MIEELQIISEKLFETDQEQDVIQYSPNTEAHGSIVFFLSPLSANCKILKRHRYLPRCNRSSAMYSIARGLIADSIDHSSLQIPNNFYINDNSYEVQNYVNGTSLIKLVRRPLGIKPKEAFGIGVQLCLTMSTLSPQPSDYKSISLWYKKTNGIIDSNIPISLVHNDLGPANIFVSKRNVHLLDWEDADFAPSVFNLFDFMFHFGSVFESGRYKRRSIENYLNVIESFERGRLKHLKSDLVNSLFSFIANDRSEKLASILGDYLSYRSNLTGSHLDILWQKLSAHSTRLQESLHFLVTR